MSIVENNNRNFIISLAIVICTGIMVPVLNFGLNLGILIQILQYLAIWAFITGIPAVIFHYAPFRAEFQLKQFSIYTGLCFIPLLIRNILVPLIGKTLTSNLDGVWDIDVIRQATGGWLFHATVFFYLALPVIALCLIIVFLGISMNKVYDIAIENALLISIPIYIFATVIAAFVGDYTLMLF